MGTPGPKGDCVGFQVSLFESECETKLRGLFSPALKGNTLASRVPSSPRQ